MYRAVYSSKYRTGFVFWVPDCHPKGKRVYLHTFCGMNITGLYSYMLYSKAKDAEEYVRGCLDFDEKRSIRCYRLGTSYKPNISKEDDKIVYRLIRRSKNKPVFDES